MINSFDDKTASDKMRAKKIIFVKPWEGEDPTKLANPTTNGLKKMFLEMLVLTFNVYKVKPNKNVLLI